MRRILFPAVLALILQTNTFAQLPVLSFSGEVELEMNQFVTQSGFASGTELFVTYQPDNRKNISMGLYFCPEKKKLSGITLHHERMLFAGNNRPESVLKPYAFYNLIYRKTQMREVIFNKDYLGEQVTYTSIEHHFGLGSEVSLGPAFFLTFEAGYGVYLGSIKKPEVINPVSGEMAGTNGFGFIGKFGLGVRLSQF